MSNTFRYLFLFLIFCSACGNDESPNGPSACGNFVNVNFEEQFGEVLIDYFFDSEGTDDHEVEYGPTGFSQGTGKVISQNGCCGLLVDDLEYPNSYDFYFRALCNGNPSSWEGPFTYALEKSLCQSPIELYVGNDLEKPYILGWWTDSDAPVTPDLYQLEYGEKDFVLGTGKNVFLNDQRYLDGVFAEGQIYDFYVKSDCNSVEDSPWVGPRSFIAEVPQNQCLVPQNLTWTDPPGDTKVRIFWDGQGDCKWEAYITTFSSAPDNPTDNTFLSEDTQIGFNDFTGPTQTISYRVFIRTICLDGSHSDWSEPISVGI